MVLTCGVISRHTYLKSVPALLASLRLPIGQRRSYSKLSYKHHIGANPLQYVSFGEAMTIAANKWPDRAAVISRQENKTLTYSELMEQADKLSAALRGFGMEKGDRLGIWAGNCTEWVVAMVAAARSGFVSVAINPLYSKREIEYCIKKVGIKVLIAHEVVNQDNYYNTLAELIPGLASNKGSLNAESLPDLKSIVLISNKAELPGVFTYNQLMKRATSVDVSNIGREAYLVNPDSGCNIQFTSGTSGNPKAVLLSHYNIVNNGYCVGERNELNQGLNKICVQVPLFHVYGVVIAISAALQHGATLVLPSVRYNTNANVEALVAEKCDIVYGTPTMHTDLVTAVKARGVTDIRARIACTGGSPVTPQLVQNLRDVIGTQRVKSVYGLTEVTAVAFQSVPKEDLQRPLNYIGHLHDHLEAKIEDDKGNLVPFGQRGELYLRGYSNMSEYWGDKEKTDETISKDGWLRTGDQVILHEDGYAEIVGRLKDLIIRGGENIAPKEVEDILSKHPDVVECHVFGVTDERLGEDICVALRLRDGCKLDEKLLIKHCSESLARYKIPKLYKQVETFPKTTSGKIQKFKLRNMVESGEL